MPFKPQTKRFALVPVEPGNEKDTDVLVLQDKQGHVELLRWVSRCGPVMLIGKHNTHIAALGFPTEGQTEGEEA